MAPKTPTKVGRSTTPTRRTNADGDAAGESKPRGTPSKRQAAASEASLVSPSKRNRPTTPRTTKGRRMGELVEDEKAHDSDDDDDEAANLGRARCLFPSEGKGKGGKRNEEPAATSKETSGKDSGRGEEDEKEDQLADLTKTSESLAALKTPRKDKAQRGPITPSSAVCSPSVKLAYSIVRKCTGSLGGNGSGGAIYGELTTGSMQKVVDMMIKYCDLSRHSRFIDIGAGLGKPNIHVAQNPGVALSYGIEHEHVRWQLSLHNLKHILQAAADQEDDGEDSAISDEESAKVKHKIFFAYGDIKDARTLDPFTHIYMFDIGFPPALFYEIAERFNRSKSDWLICYHGPKLMIERYGFDVEFLAQQPTSMHGSSEGHTAYCYRRVGSKGGNKAASKVTADPAFSEGLRLLQQGTLHDLRAWVSDKLDSHMTSPRPVRRSSKLFANEV